jgi:hypothetical protein
VTTRVKGAWFFGSPAAVATEAAAAAVASETAIPAEIRLTGVKLVMVSPSDLVTAICGLSDRSSLPPANAEVTAR